jgi:ankyrin repeat protein
MDTSKILTEACETDDLLLLSEGLHGYQDVDLIFRQTDGSHVTPLLTAVRHRSHAVIRELLARGADIDITNDVTGNSALHEICSDPPFPVGDEDCASVEAKDVAIVSDLLFCNPILTTTNANIEQPVMLAARSRSVEKLYQLLKYMPSQVHYFSGILRTPLHLAAETRRMNNCRLLLDFGAEVDPIARTFCLKMSETPVQLTPLYLAYRNSYFDIVEFLISRGASWTSLMSPLHLAAVLGERKKVEWLSQDTVDINITDCHQRTALHLASRLGYIPIVTTLIQNGADLQIQDSDGHTPLAVACHAGHPDVVEYLISYGADVQGDGKHLPLEIACRRGYTEVVTKLLHCAPYALNDCNSDEILLCACRQCHVEIVQKLLLQILESQIAIDKRTRSDALCAASICKSFRSVATVRDLVTFGADVNLRDKKGRLALHCAIMTGNVPLAKFLIDSGAKATSPLAPGFLGRKTALYVACDKENFEMARVLIQAGAYINVYSEGTRLGSPLSVACFHGNLEIAKLLLESGAYVSPPRRQDSLHPLPPLMALVDAWFLNMLERKRLDRSRYISVFQLLQDYGCQFDVLNMDDIMLKLYKLDRDGCLFVLHGACAKLRHIRDSLLSIILDRNDMDAIAILTDRGYMFGSEQLERVTNNRDLVAVKMVTQRVRETVSNSVSLLGHCRVVLRQILSRRHVSIRGAVAKLPLPVRIKDYLNMDIH